MDYARITVGMVGSSPCRRSVSAAVTMASAVVLLTIGTACSSSSSSSSSSPAPAAAPAPVLVPQAASGAQAAPTDHPGHPDLQPASLGQPAEALDIEDLVMGNGKLPALEGSHGKATQATCESSTVSSPPDVSATTTALCVILYSDSSLWQQKVTITFDSQGNPVDSSADVGTELSVGTSPSSST